MVISKLKTGGSRGKRTAGTDDIFKKIKTVFEEIFLKEKQ